MAASRGTGQIMGIGGGSPNLSERRSPAALANGTARPDSRETRAESGFLFNTRTLDRRALDRRAFDTRTGPEGGFLFATSPQSMGLGSVPRRQTDLLRSGPENNS